MIGQYCWSTYSSITLSCEATNGNTAHRRRRNSDTSFDESDNDQQDIHWTPRRVLVQQTHQHHTQLQNRRFFIENTVNTETIVEAEL